MGTPLTAPITVVEATAPTPTDMAPPIVATAPLAREPHLIKPIV